MLALALVTLVTPIRSSGPACIRFDRAAANAGAWIAEHPDDAAGYEVLGRLHAFAFTGGRDYAYSITYDETPLPTLVGISTQSWFRNAYGPRWSKLAFLRTDYRKMGAPVWVPTPAESIDHIEKAIRNLRRAIALAPDSGRPHLALGFLLQNAAHLAPMVDSLELFDMASKEPLQWEEWKAWDDALSRPKPSYESSLRLEGIEGWCRSNWPYVCPARADPRPLIQSRASQLMSDSWTSLALWHYREAIRLTSEADASLAHKPFDLEYAYRSSEVVSFEAGRYVQTILEAFDGKDPTVVELRAAIVAQEEKLMAKRYPPSVGISPLVLSLHVDLAEAMIAPASSACFDLDGDGVDESWEWVRPDTAFVVWDPNRESRIRSGRDLFGQASFGLFPSDGFMALSLLDDDHDGWVSGLELDGVRLWFDRDSDGRSTSSEVADVETFGITALACGASRTIANGKVIDDGVRLSTGRSLVLFDWYAKSTPGR